MLLAAHVAVGAAISSAIGQPYLAIPLSFASHYILDCVPHWEPNYSKNPKLTRNIIIANIVLAILTIVLFTLFLPGFITSGHENNFQIYPFSLSPWEVFFCCFATTIPTLLVYLSYFMKKSIPFLKWNTFLKKHLNIVDNKIGGKIVQVGTILVFGLYAFRQLPNSESNFFLQIILLMLFIVAIMAILEMFTEEEK